MERTRELQYTPYWRIFQAISFLSSIRPAFSLPINRRITSVEPSTDVWSETLAGIGPLVLLIGERNTKQLLKNIRGLHNSYSLAVAPLGLISVLISLIRLYGSPKLRAFVGYELEARASAGIEMTRINCGGVHAELVDGYIVRSTTADLSNQLVAVSMMEGGDEGIIKEAVAQVRNCDEFEKAKAIKGIAGDVAVAQWCLHVVSGPTNGRILAPLLDYLADILEVNADVDKLRLFKGIILSSFSTDKHEIEAEAISRTPTTGVPAFDKKGLGVEVNEISPLARSPYSLENEKLVDNGQESSLHVSFLLTLDAVSEFCTSSPVSDVTVVIVGTVSLLSMLAVQSLALWQQGGLSAGWLLMFLGYVGIILGVLSAATLIHRSCNCLHLPRCASAAGEWTDGVLVVNKKKDSMDTSGSSFYSSSKPRQIFEAVAMRDNTIANMFLTWMISIGLTLSFISHYLGLRSSKWWLAICELAICLTAAFIRSITNDRQQKFSVVEGVKLDKNCSSTGILWTQHVQLIDKPLFKPDMFDLRAYAPSTTHLPPVTAEQIAWHTAKLCHEDHKTTSHLMELTGMTATAVKLHRAGDMRAILVSFTGGVLVSEGLAFPNARMCLGFRSSISDLGAPTPLLVRAIMRQPQWYVERPEFGKDNVPIGNVYIFAVNSVIDWWTIAEDRNDMGDWQKNLMWPLLLINIAFFLALMDSCKDDEELINGIEATQRGIGEESKRTAEAVLIFLSKTLM